MAFLYGMSVNNTHQSEDRDAKARMTLEEKELTSPGLTGVKPPSLPLDVMDYSVPTREKPVLHPAVDPILCQLCRQAELSFFDPNCPTCQDMLMNPATTVPQIFAILRQWTPQTQQNLEMLIRQVLKRGANPNDRDGLTDMTLLHYTAKAGAQGIGDVDEACRMATLLLQDILDDCWQRGADVLVRCRWTNMTALHYAVYFDVAPVVSILLQHSNAIDVDSKCTEFEHGTSLHVAAANLSYESAKTLLQHHANPKAKDGLGRTPLDCVPDGSNFDAESDMGRLVSRLKQLLTDSPEPFAGHFTATSAAAAELSTLGLAIGDRVMVGGVKCGILRYCGPTKFSAGIWAGIELEEPAGKNDGSVAGVSYFKCSPKYGIFAPLSKLGKPGAAVTPSKPAPAHHRSPSTPHSAGSAKAKKVNVSNVKSKIDTGLRRSYSLLTPALDEHLDVGDHVMVGGHKRGVVRYSGKTEFAPGWWYGLELEKPDGKNDGSVNGKKYFSCKPKHGVFAPPSRVQKISEFGSRDSLDSFSSLERQRRLSAGGTGGSTGNLAGTPSPSTKKPLQRPKTAGTIGQMKRSLSTSSVGVPAPELKLSEGMSVFCNNELGTIRYMGAVDFAEGTWLGVELRTPKGKNDGSVQGKRYFTCKPNHGLIVRPSKVTVRGINGAKLVTEQSGAGAGEGGGGGGDEGAKPNAHEAQHTQKFTGQATEQIHSGQDTDVKRVDKADSKPAEEVEHSVHTTQNE